jgi:hypothetical protein
MVFGSLMLFALASACCETPSAWAIVNSVSPALTV